MCSGLGTFKVLSLAVVQERCSFMWLEQRNLRQILQEILLNKGIWGSRKVCGAKQPCDQTYVLASDSAEGWEEGAVRKKRHREQAKQWLQQPKVKENYEECCGTSRLEGTGLSP